MSGTEKRTSSTFSPLDALRRRARIRSAAASAAPFFTSSGGTGEEVFDLAELFAKDLFGRHWIAQHALPCARSRGSDDVTIANRSFVAILNSQDRSTC